MPRVAVGRVVLKTVILFLIINAAWYVFQPLDWLNRITIYNTLVSGRERLPFGEYPAESYNVSVTSIDQMLASHVVARPKTEREYRVLLIGDSSVWGYLLQPSQTQAACLNRRDFRTADGRPIEVYNLGYPKLTVVKDLLILQKSLQYQPDLILWSTTLASLYPTDQLDFALIKAQYRELDELQRQYNFNLKQYPLPTREWHEQTLIGQRRDIADWLRYQFYGPAWGATIVDHAVPKFIAPHPVDIRADEDILTVGLMSLKQGGLFQEVDLNLDVVRAGIDIAGSANVPVILINEPIYRDPDSPNRYNTYYPKWAYDTYRDTMDQVAERDGWRYYDLWDSVPPDDFTDTDFHLTPEANCTYAARLRTIILDNAGSEPVTESTP